MNGILFKEGQEYPLLITIKTPCVSLAGAKIRFS